MYVVDGIMFLCPSLETEIKEPQANSISWSNHFQFPTAYSACRSNLYVDF